MKIFTKFDSGLSNNNILDYAAKEIINIEQSKYIFDLGKELPKDKQIIGYPKLNINDVEYNIKASEGIIFITNSISLDVIIDELIALLNKIESDYNIKNNLMDYHTMSSNMLTNIKVKNDQKLIKTYNDNDNYVNKGQYSNLKRLFVKYFCVLPDNMYPRFTWYISYIDTFKQFNIDFTNVRKSIVYYINSIFLDFDGISKYKNNDIDYNFNYTMIKAYDNIILEEIKLSECYNPIHMSLSTKKHSNIKNYTFMYDRKQNYKSEYIYYSNLNSKKIYRMDINNLNIHKIGKSNKLHYKCYMCKNKLYDDNYVLCGDIGNPDNENGKIICPICLHSNVNISNDYLYIFRVRFPNTIYDIIKESKFTEIKKNILREILKMEQPIKIENLNVKNNNIYYININNKYYLFKNIHEYIFNGHLLNNSYKVCFESLNI